MAIGSSDLRLCFLASLSICIALFWVGHGYLGMVGVGRTGGL